MQKLIYGSGSKSDIQCEETKTGGLSTQSLLQNKVEQLREKYRQMRNDSTFRKAKTPKNVDPDIQKLIKESKRKYNILR